MKQEDLIGARLRNWNLFEPNADTLTVPSVNGISEQSNPYGRLRNGTLGVAFCIVSINKLMLWPTDDAGRFDRGAPLLEATPRDFVGDKGHSRNTRTKIL